MMTGSQNVKFDFKSIGGVKSAWPTDRRLNRVFAPRRSTRGHVSITQDVSLTLQILETVLDYITDADDAGELSVAQHRHVAHAMARHQVHHATDTLVRGH